MPQLATALPRRRRRASTHPCQPQQRIPPLTHTSHPIRRSPSPGSAKGSSVRPRLSSTDTRKSGSKKVSADLRRRFSARAMASTASLLAHDSRRSAPGVCASSTCGTLRRCSNISSVEHGAGENPQQQRCFCSLAGGNNRLHSAKTNAGSWEMLARRFAILSLSFSVSLFSLARVMLARQPARHARTCRLPRTAVVRNPEPRERDSPLQQLPQRSRCASGRRSHGSRHHGESPNVMNKRGGSRPTTNGQKWGAT